MTPPLATVTEIERRMTPSDYEREREQIRATYGDSAGEAAALRDQALAKLFYRSGWTQEELAKKEGTSQSFMGKRLRFGRFLGFSPAGTIPRNLSERKFRDYWEPAQYYQGCIYAWNAFREEKQIKDVKSDTKKGMHQAK